METQIDTRPHDGKPGPGAAVMDNADFTDEKQTVDLCSDQEDDFSRRRSVRADVDMTLEIGGARPPPPDSDHSAVGIL